MFLTYSTLLLVLLPKLFKNYDADGSAKAVGDVAARVLQNLMNGSSYNVGYTDELCCSRPSSGAIQHSKNTSLSCNPMPN